MRLRDPGHSCATLFVIDNSVIIFVRSRFGLGVSCNYVKLVLTETHAYYSLCVCVCVELETGEKTQIASRYDKLPSQQN